MLILYTRRDGARRIIYGYEWSTQNNNRVEVPDAETCLALITHPPGDFAIAPDDPLVLKVGMQEAERLLLNGISTLAQYDAQQAAVAVEAKPEKKPKRPKRAKEINEQPESGGEE